MMKAPKLPDDLDPAAAAALEEARRPRPAPARVKAPKLPSRLSVAARVALAAARFKRGIKKG